jgi:hypothetical protein
MKTINIAAWVMLITITGSASAQSNPEKIEKADTVIVPLAKTSKVVFTIEDRSDLEILKHYNFQDLFQDIIRKLESTDTVTTTEEETIASRNEDSEDWRSEESSSDNSEGSDDGEAEDENRDAEERYRARHGDYDNDRNDNDDDENDWREYRNYRRGRSGRTWQSTNMDFGINNFLASDGQLPDENELYAVRPWGSWYVGINSTQRTRLSRNFFMEWGLGVSWYNFKFENDNVLISKDADQVLFTEQTNVDYDYIKSKLRVTYLNVSLVPLLDFGDHSRKPRVWDGYGNSFRIGVGPYAGYRIGAKSKNVFQDDGDRMKDKNRDSFYLNDLRYGLRLQLGFRSTDFFVNYDVNELFKTDRGPKLNAVSFGVIF